MKIIIPTLHVATVAFLYVLLATFGFWMDNIYIWLGLWLCMGGILVGMYALVHETVHGILFQSYFANRLVGIIASLITLDIWSYYRAWHYAHHMHLGTEKDSEEEFVFKNKFDYLLQFLTYTPPIHNMEEYFVRHQGKYWSVYVTKNKNTIVFDFFALGVWIGVLIVGLILFPVFFLFGYLIPLFISMKCMFLMDVAEHYGIRESKNVFISTRTVYSNFLVRFFVFNVNLHTAHHNIHTTPYLELTRETKRIRAKIQNFEDSYFRFHANIFKCL